MILRGCGGRYGSTQHDQIQTHSRVHWSPTTLLKRTSMFNSRSKQANDQQISIPAILLERKDGMLSPAIGPRRKLVSQLVATGEWVRQCFEDLSLQWLGTIVTEEILRNDKIKSLLIQTGDGNILLILIDDSEIPASVAHVQLTLTAEVAVGNADDIETEGTIKPSDQLWPFVALAKHEDPSACVFVWIVRDASLPYPTGSVALEHNRRKQTALRLFFQRTGNAPILTDIKDITDLPQDFWRV